MTRGRLYVRRPSSAVAIFLASECHLDSGAVIATGRWRDLPNKPPGEFVWPISRILEIRWEVVA